MKDDQFVPDMLANHNSTCATTIFDGGNPCKQVLVDRTVEGVNKRQVIQTGIIPAGTRHYNDVFTTFF